jgi:hypothetical protein
MQKHSIMPRVSARPNPDEWGEDELMTLAEAEALFWPHGPISERTLRTAIRDGRLPISQVARKFFVTKAALRSLSTCKPIASDADCAERSAKPSAFERDLAAVRAMRTGSGKRRDRTP